MVVVCIWDLFVLYYSSRIFRYGHVTITAQQELGIPCIILVHIMLAHFLISIKLLIRVPLLSHLVADEGWQSQDGTIYHRDSIETIRKSLPLYSRYSRKRCLHQRAARGCGSHLFQGKQRAQEDQFCGCGVRGEQKIHRGQHFGN